MKYLLALTLLFVIGCNSYDNLYHATVLDVYPKQEVERVRIYDFRNCKIDYVWVPYRQGDVVGITWFFQMTIMADQNKVIEALTEEK